MCQACGKSITNSLLRSKVTPGAAIAVDGDGYGDPLKRMSFVLILATQSRIWYFSTIHFTLVRIDRRDVLMKYAYVVAVLAGFVVMLNGCTKEQPQPPNPRQQSLTQGNGEGASNVAGIRWTVPPRWGEHPPRQMRVATYIIPPANGDTEGGECAVFFFGGGQGGDVEANINRWVGQFENAGTPKRSTKTVDGMKVWTVEVAGTYLAPAGPMMQSQGKFENYRLLGAIIDAPEGSVFFKFTGPRKTVAATEAEFDELVASVTKL